MEENIGAFEEKKRKKGGKRLMKPEKAVRASAESCGETPPRVPRETSGKAGKVIAIVAAVLEAAYLAFGAWVSAGQCIYPNVMLGRGQLRRHERAAGSRAAPEERGAGEGRGR